MNNRKCRCGCGRSLQGRKNQKFASRKCKDGFFNKRRYWLGRIIEKALREKGLEIREIICE